METGKSSLLAEVFLSTDAMLAFTTRMIKPRHTNSVPDLPILYSTSNILDHTDDLVSGSDRVTGRDDIALNSM